MNLHLDETLYQPSFRLVLEFIYYLVKPSKHGGHYIIVVEYIYIYYTQRIFIIKYIRCLTRFEVGFEPQTCIFSAWMYHLQENPIILGYFGCNHQGFRLVLFRDFPTNSNPKIDRQDGNKKRTPGKQ